MSRPPSRLSPEHLPPLPLLFLPPHAHIAAATAAAAAEDVADVVATEIPQRRCRQLHQQPPRQQLLHGPDANDDPAAHLAALGANPNATQPLLSAPAPPRPTSRSKQATPMMQTPPSTMPPLNASQGGCPPVYIVLQLPPCSYANSFPWTTPPYSQPQMAFPQGYCHPPQYAPFGSFAPQVPPQCQR